MANKWRKILIFAVAVFVVADFILWSQAPQNHTRWCKLSDFTYNPEKESVVSIVPSDYPSLSRACPITEALDYEQVEEMVSLAVELAGGFENMLGPTDRKIVIKPNIVEPAPNGNGVNTDWRVVKALALLLYRLNPELEIAVAEGAGGWARPGTPNAPAWSLSDGYKISGYQEMIESMQNDPACPGLNLKWVDLNYDDTVKVTVPVPRISNDQTCFFLPRTIVEADFIIDAPVLKVHTTGITVGLKNWVGLLPGMVYGWSKDAGYNRNGIGLDHTPNRLQENMVEIMRTVRCDLVVVDGIVGKELSKYTAGYPKRRNMIVAGTDVVSVDAVCARLMDINPDDVEHISLAALTGLGQNDLGQIEVRGSSIAESGTRFIKSESEILQNYKNDRYPYYGQGNRIWLLSGPHFGLDMDKDFLGGEADIEPIPGQKGWSEPVYFFDDPIDPAGYFQDTLDCVNYAFTYLEAQKQARGKLWLGSRQDLTVWLNGAVVYTYKGTRTHRLPNDAVEVDIRAGINRILVKSAQRYGVSEFSLNVCETESDSSYAGNRLAGIKFLSESEEADSIRADYNRDGRLNILDAVTLLRTIQENPSEECDFNGDGSIDVTDVIGLIVYIVDRK